MCSNSCVAYTGPFSECEVCPFCQAPRYHLRNSNKPQPVQRFYTIPLGPQLQALWHSPDGAKQMHYHNQHTAQILTELHKTNGVIKTYDDVFHGLEYLNAIRVGNIQEDDVLMMLSLDGAQLYHDKESDCWFFIWVILNQSPQLWCKKKKYYPWWVCSWA
ncbi:hypothetical protein AMATHDRAFT_147692 [Amanita thiersii Skay4041]|uniref:Uncharacterized protein n=1 Tax=Amanita thiersii Skay4041 TaxID=703135 RepID=A0A2A9NH85_9AGAR|nr:hypothetical protein AMATHDRAFT_147692 [Amanita thiersii Skay4041]